MVGWPYSSLAEDRHCTRRSVSQMPCGHVLSLLLLRILPFRFRTYYCDNYEELKLLNPGFPLMMRTVENAMPAVTTELEWTVQDLLRFMIQTGRFRDVDGTISQARVEAAQAYLATDWDKLTAERFKSPGFDPERPYLDKD